MSLVLHIVAWAYIALSVVLIARYGYLASVSSVGRRKARARLIANLTFSSWLITLPLLYGAFESRQPTFTFEGVIEAVNVENSDSRHFSAWLQIATTTGGEITIHVSGRNDRWRVGQRLRVVYFGDTGELILADFLGPNGQNQGFSRRTAWFSRAILIAFGFFLDIGIIKRYQRDPEARQERGAPPSSLSDAVDEDSLLHLSNTPHGHEPSPRKPRLAPDE